MPKFQKHTGYKMETNIPSLLDLNEELSSLDIPVFEKKLVGSAGGWANMDRTIIINSKLNKKEKADVVEHEKEHVLQMRKGEAWYDSNNVYHKPNLGDPIQTYKRVGDHWMVVNGKIIALGDKNNPVEKSIYNKTKNT